MILCVEASGWDLVFGTQSHPFSLVIFSQILTVQIESLIFSLFCLITFANFYRLFSSSEADASRVQVGQRSVSSILISNEASIFCSGHFVLGILTSVCDTVVTCRAQAACAWNCLDCLCWAGLYSSRTVLVEVCL